MKIRYNTAVSGFSATTVDPDEGEKREKTLNFHPLDLRIKKEILAKKSAIQAIFAKHFGVPDLFQNSKAFIGDDEGYICTPAQALEALTDLQKQDLMRDDRTIPLAEIENSTEYRDVVKQAVEMGASHFHKPAAYLNIEIRVRPEEEKFVNNNFPPDILGAIGIFPYVPEAILPIVQIARNVTSDVRSLAASAHETYSVPVTNRRVKEVIKHLEGDKEIAAYFAVPPEHQGLKDSLLDSLESTWKSLNVLMEEYHWIDTIRTILDDAVKLLPMESGPLSVYDRRLATSNTVIVKASVGDSEITDDLDL